MFQLVNGSSIESTFLQYGVIGALLLLFLVFARQAHNREVKRADAAELEIRRLNEYILEKAIPALISSGEALKESNELFKKVLEAGAHRG